MTAGLLEAFERIGAAAEGHLPQTHAAGLAIGVTDRSELLGVVVRGFADVASGSPVRPETRFEIGSISKQFASVVCLQEVDAGRLDLHARVNELLPWIDLPEPFGPITLHHLLTHTSGLAIGMEESPTGPGAASLLRTIAPTVAPGERFWYSNDGYKLVGMVLERISGMPIHDLLRERLFVPLGMRSTDGSITNETRLDCATGYEPAFDDRPPSLSHPLVPARWTVSNTADGSIVSNVSDMCAWARVLLGHGTCAVGAEEVRLISDDAWDLFTTGYVEGDLSHSRYGYGINVRTRDGRSMLAHSGGMVGYTAYLQVDLDSGVGICVLQNGSGDKERLVNYGLDVAAAAIAGVELPEVPEMPSANAIPGAASFVGSYEGDGRIRLEPSGEGLRLVEGPLAVQLERWPDKADAFLVPQPIWDKHLLKAVRSENGRVTELTHGARRFVPEGRSLPPADEPEPEWLFYPGLYRSNNPWAPVARVYLCAGRLHLEWPGEFTDEVDGELIPLEGGWFAVDEEWRPQRLRFHDIRAGLATILEFNGGRWYRSFED